MLEFEMMVEKAQNAVAQLLTDESQLLYILPPTGNFTAYDGGSPLLQLRFQAQVDARGGAPHEREAHETPSKEEQ